MSSNKESSSSSKLQQDLLETTQKVEASLQQAIQEHTSSSDFSPSQGLDFLDVKNSVLLSYLIELTYDLRNRLMHESGSGRCSGSGGRSEASLHRLITMKTVLDKSRGLDKKLRYQIDKLLAAGATSSTFATATPNAGGEEEDPLSFRPDAAAMDPTMANDDGDSSSSDGDDEEQVEHDDDEEEDDDDLKAARLTMAMAREKKSRKSEEEEDEDGEASSNVYRAPRLAAVPYTQDREDKAAQKEKRRLGRMRASELAQTLRSQYGDAPDQEDARGGSDFGRQREAARRMAEREEAKTQFEEETFVRMATTRKERKERQRLLRDESSNLGAIANLDNLIRDTQNYSGRNRGGGRSDDDDYEDRKRAAMALANGDDGYDDNDGMLGGRHDNGKRKRQMLNVDGKDMPSQKKGRKSLQAKNSLQAAMFGGGSSASKKSKKKKRNSY